MTVRADLILQDLKVALRSLWRSKGLSITVIVTLALGIGANAAIFSLVRGVLLRPLVNRGEDRLIYIRQSAPGYGDEEAAFSVPEVQDLKTSVKSVGSFGQFSTMGFTMIGLGEPREVRAGVVDGSYFDVMGLRPVLGRLLDQRDDGPNAAGACVLTYRFWKDSLKGDPTVIGKTIRLDPRTATVVGVLEPSVQYPSQTEILVNVVTSPHHLSATMVTGRVHRMTELFGRLAPNATLDQARAELRTDYAAMLRAHPEAYPASAHYQIDAVMLRDQITSGAKTILWVLLAASGLIFIIACSNVANLILARSVRREGELAIRAALGASTSALRRTLLAESLLLSVAGAVLGVLSAQPMVAVLARYASRFSVRALDLKVDMTVLWVGAALAVISAVLLAFVPRLPSVESSGGIGLASSSNSVRISSGTSRRLRIFAVTQIAASFMLLAGASVLIKTLITLQETRTGFDMHRVLAVNVPVMSFGKTSDDIINFYREVIGRISELPGVDRVALGTSVPWRDAGNFGPGLQFTGEGHIKGNHEEDPLAQLRVVSPGFFASLGVPLIAGRDFNDNDRRGGEPVVILSQSAAQRMFPGQDPINRHIMWTDPVMDFVYISHGPRRVVGVVADVDDEHIEPEPMAHHLPSLWASSRRHQQGAAAVRRPAVRPYPLRSSCLDHPADAHHPRPVCGTAGGESCHAGRHSRRSADAGPAEYAGLQWPGGAGAGDCRGRRRRRAGVLGQRTHTRVRYPAGGGSAAQTLADGRYHRRYGDGCVRHRGGRNRRLRVSAPGRQLFPVAADAERVACDCFGHRAVGCRNYRVHVSGGTSCTRGRDRSPAC